MKVDLLNANHDRQARRATAILAVVFTLSVGILSAIGAAASYRSVTRGTGVLGEISKLPVITDIRKLVLGDTVFAEHPEPTPDGRMNVMLFGIGGTGHDGAQLTDTIIFTSIDTQNGKAGMLSIPRDLAFPLGGGRFQKINAVNAYAELEHPGEGAMIAARDIGKLLGVRIDHVVKIDFKGFEKFINALDGIDIMVERSFVDDQYPTADEKIQTVSFKKGVQHMNGAQALIYVRSRHGNNGEGSDFARSRRQQQVLEAVRDKLLSLGTLTNPSRIADLWNVVSGNIQTDLSVWDLVKLAPLAHRFDRSNITSRVLTDAPGGELVATRVEGLGSTEFPRKPDWSEIRELAQNPFRTDAEKATEERPKQEVRLEIKNGTFRTGFAAQVATTLKKKGYLVGETNNAKDRTYERSVIVDMTGGKKPEELAQLKKILNADISSTLIDPTNTPTSTRVVYPNGHTAEPLAATSTDFLIILGESSLALIDPYASQTTP